MRVNKKLNKCFDLSNVVRAEVEFVMAADFMKVRQEFDKMFLSTGVTAESKSGPQKVDLETCIKNFTNPSLFRLGKRPHSGLRLLTAHYDAKQQPGICISSS